MVLSRVAGLFPLSLAALASCAERPPEVPPALLTLPPPPVTQAPAPSSSSTPDAAPIASATPAASPAAPPSPAGSLRVSVTLRPGDPPCTLVFDALTSEDAGTFTAESVKRISTEAGGACRAQVLYDVATEKSPDPPEPPSPLVGGDFRKPGQPGDQDEYNRLTDLDFDGYADLCVRAMAGSYSYSQRCWLYAPAKRAFVRTRELEGVLFMKIDPARRVLSSYVRATRNAYMASEHAWEQGKLVKTLEVVTYLEARPDGQPLPAGFKSFVVRRERRGGRLVQVKAGPERGPP